MAGGSGGGRGKVGEMLDLAASKAAFILDPDPGALGSGVRPAVACLPNRRTKSPGAVGVAQWARALGFGLGVHGALLGQGTRLLQFWGLGADDRKGLARRVSGAHGAPFP